MSRYAAYGSGNSGSVIVPDGSSTMCGRYFLDTLPELLQQQFKVHKFPVYPARNNIRPSEQVAIVCRCWWTTPNIGCADRRAKRLACCGQPRNRRWFERPCLRFVRLSRALMPRLRGFGLGRKFIELLPRPMPW